MITSQQINQMHMASMSMHGAAPMAGAPGMQAAPGMSQYPPTFSYSMAGYQNPNERMANRLVGAGMGAAQGMMGGVNTAVGLGTGAASLLSMFGVGGTGMAMAGGLPGMAVAGGGMLAAAGMSQMAQGMQYQSQVNQMFGNMQFANPANPLGRGFTRRDLNQLYGAVRAIDQNDPFVSMQDAMRVTQRFGSQFGLQQGVKDAEELSKRVRQMGETLAEMAKVMGTTLDEAGQVMGMQRQAGFYSAADVMGNTQTFMRGRGFGFTSNQMGMTQIQGAGMSRGMGLTGQAGSRFASGMALDLASMMRSGVLSDRDLMDATGASTRNDAAMAFSQRAQGVMQSTLSGSFGQAILAGLMDPSGGFDSGRMRQLSTGQMGIDEVRRLGSRALGTQQGKLSFVENKDLLMGEFMGSDDSMSAIVNILDKTAQDTGKSTQMLVQQITGMNARDTRLFMKAARNVRKTKLDRLKDAALEIQMQERQQFIRENRTLGGITQQITGGIADVFSPLQDMGARAQANLGDRIEDVIGVGLGFAGVGQTAQFGTTMTQVDEITRALGQRSILGDSADVGDILAGFGGEGMSLTDRLTRMSKVSGMDSFRSGLGSTAGAAARISSSQRQKIKTLARSLHSAPASERAEILRKMRAAAAGEPLSQRVDMHGTPLHTMSATRRKLRSNIRDRIAHFSAEGREVELDRIIADAAGDTGLAAIKKGRAQEEVEGSSELFETVEEAQKALREIGGRDTAAVGAAGGILRLLGVFGEDAGDILAEGGSSAELVAKASSAKSMKEIDDIIRRAVEETDTPQAARELAAKRIKGKFGIDVSAKDVSIYERTMKNQTGKRAAERSYRADENPEAYEKEFSKGVDAGKIALKATRSVARDKIVAQGKRLLGSLEAGLGGELGVRAGGLAVDEDIQASLRDLMLASLDDESFSLTELGKGSAEAKLFRDLRGESLNAIQEAKGGMEVGRLLEITKAKKGSDLSKMIHGMASSRGMLSQSQVEKVMAERSAGRLMSLLPGGAAAMELALQDGMTPDQLQTEKLMKMAQMVDALYAVQSGTDVLDASNPVGANGQKTVEANRAAGVYPDKK